MNDDDLRESLGVTANELGGLSEPSSGIALPLRPCVEMCLDGWRGSFYSYSVLRRYSTSTRRSKMITGNTDVENREKEMTNCPSCIGRCGCLSFIILLHDTSSGR